MATREHESLIEQAKALMGDAEKMFSLDFQKMNGEQRAAYKQALYTMVEPARALLGALQTRKWERFEAQDYQVPFFESRKKYICLFAGNRAGKSMSAMCYIVMFLMDRLRNRRKPNWPIHGRVSSVDYATLERVHIPLFREFVDHRILKGGNWEEAVRRSGGAIVRVDLADGGWVEFKTHEQSVESYQAVQLDFYWMDEACRNQEIWVENKMRLLDRGGFGIHTLSPLTDITWEVELEELAQDPETAGEYDFFRWDTTWNKYLSKDELAVMMRDLTVEQVLMRIKGIAAKMGNRVYWSFRRDRNIIRPFPLPGHWPRIIVFDMHDTKAHAVDWFAIDPDDQIYWYRALKKRCSASDLAKTVRGMTGMEPVAMMLIDPSATKTTPNRIVDDKSFYAQLLEAGLEVQLGVVGDKAAHIVRVNEFMTPDPITGRPRVMIFDTLEAPRFVEATEWPPINEIEHYIYIRNRSAEARKDSMQVRDKWDDHCVNLRILCAHDPQYRYLLPLNRSARRSADAWNRDRFRPEPPLYRDEDYHATHVQRPAAPGRSTPYSDYN